MNYKRPKTPVFWVPVPDTGQSRMDLVAWRHDENQQPQRMELTDPDAGAYTVEILDSLGPYEMENIPDFLARQVINERATGRALFAVLRQRVKEFKMCKKVYFYQVNPLQSNG